jgi:hypothetical protein
MRAKEFITESTEKKYAVTYDYFGSNPEKPLYTKTHTVRANSPQEAIDILKNLVGGRNHQAKEINVQEEYKNTPLDQVVRQEKQREKYTTKAKQNLGEQVSDEVIQEVAKATEWCCNQLNLKNIPAIELSMDHDEAQGNHHTGGHVPGSGKIWVYAKNRNLVDLLRTVFHELVHVRQHELNLIQPNSSYPGSPIEMVADAMAGKLIKIYGKNNKQIFQ